MIVMYEQDGAKYVQISTQMTPEEWRDVQVSFLDVTTDLMVGQLSHNGKNGLANLMQLLKDMILNDEQTVRGLQAPTDLPAQE